VSGRTGLRVWGKRLVAAGVALATPACEYVGSDAATRVRYDLGRETVVFRASSAETTTITVTPDHWPEGCGGVGYTLRITPDDGHKQVRTGDIFVRCDDGHPYYTGLGSERIYVTRELQIARKSGEPVQIVMRKTEKGVELVELK
jgi:hypothetical protein